MFELFPANFLAFSNIIFISVISFLPTVDRVQPHWQSTPTVTIPVPLPTLIQIFFKYGVDLPVFHLLMGCYMLTVAVLGWLVIKARYSGDCPSSGLGFVLVGTGTGFVNTTSYRPWVAHPTDQVPDLIEVAASSPPPPPPPPSISSSLHPSNTVVQRWIIFLILVALTGTCILQPQVNQPYFHVHIRHLVNFFLSKVRVLSSSRSLPVPNVHLTLTAIFIP